MRTIMEQLRRALAIARKDMRIYYSKGPVVIFGILFPIFLFLSFTIGRNFTVDFMIPGLLGMINTKYGWNWTDEDFFTLGKQVLKWERDFNLRAGLSPAMDRLPLFFYKEPVPPLNSVFDIPDSVLDSFYNF